MSRVEIYREIMAAQMNASAVFGHDTAAYVAKTTPGTRLGKWRWRFVSNGRVMADSGQGYSRRIDCLSGCATVLGGRVIVGDPENVWVYRLTEGPGRDDPVPVVDLTREATS